MQQNCIFKVYIMQYSLIFEQVNVPDSCFRLYGPRCGGCGEGISPSDLIRKAKDKVFHVKCFLCQVWSETVKCQKLIIFSLQVCRKQLSTGEELYILDRDKFLCKDDYYNLKNNQGAYFFLSDSYTNDLYS